MRNKLVIRCAAICMAAFMVITPVNASAALLRRGSSGSDVKQVQTTLKDLGYFTYSKTTGFYGRITEDAVRRFQRANGIAADGIIGNNTRSLLYTDGNKTASAENTSDDTNTYSGALDWFSQVRSLWDRGENATITDVNTGKSFQVKRTYGTNHADVEPLTKKDTAIVKEIWGGFSWTRRAVVVEIGSYTIAASMTAMPHAGVDSKTAGRYVSNRSGGYGYGVNLDAVKNNGCSGVMDIHFKNSRTHTTNTKQSSHQNMVAKADKYIKNLEKDLIDEIDTVLVSAD